MYSEDSGVEMSSDQFGLSGKFKIMFLMFRKESQLLQ